ncbi:MAG: hypothetical protein J7L26_12560 [Candidatus Aminicenantes bacterium]|nr:hypothetical protein [Candidatus Aminicenantes bacterium]
MTELDLKETKIISKARLSRLIIDFENRRVDIEYRILAINETGGISEIRRNAITLQDMEAIIDPDTDEETSPVSYEYTEFMSALKRGVDLKTLLIQVMRKKGVIK